MKVSPIGPIRKGTILIYGLLLNLTAIPLHPPSLPPHVSHLGKCQIKTCVSLGFGRSPNLLALLFLSSLSSEKFRGSNISVNVVWITVNWFKRAHHSTLDNQVSLLALRVNWPGGLPGTWAPVSPSSSQWHPHLFSQNYTASCSVWLEGELETSINTIILTRMDRKLHSHGKAYETMLCLLFIRAFVLNVIHLAACPEADYPLQVLWITGGFEEEGQLLNHLFLHRSRFPAT